MFSLRRAKTAPNFGVAPSKSLFVDVCADGVLFEGLLLLENPFPLRLCGVDDDPADVSGVSRTLLLRTSAGVTFSDMVCGW